MAQWDEEWKQKRNLEATAALRRLVVTAQATSPDQKIALAEARTAEAEQQINQLENILVNAIGRDTRIQWEDLKDYSEFAKPRPAEAFVRPPVVKEPIMPRPPVEPVKPKVPQKLVPPDLSEKPSPDEPRFRTVGSALLSVIPGIAQKRERDGSSLFLKAREAWNAKVRAYNEQVAAYNDSLLKLRETYRDDKETYRRLMAQYEEECRTLRQGYEDHVKTANQVYENDLIREKAKYRRNLSQWDDERALFYAKQRKRNTEIDGRRQGFLECKSADVIEYCDMVLSRSDYPNYFPQRFDMDYIEETKTLVLDYYLPHLEDLPKIKEWKYVQSKDAVVDSPLAEPFRNKLYDDLVCQVALRVMHELFTADTSSTLESIVFNGRVESIDKATGLPFDACVLSVQAKKQELNQFNLALLDPKACIRKLRGVASAKLHQLAPVAPICQIDRSDKRFVIARAIAGQLEDSANLAAMDWEDFEHLIRELFEKEFSANGGEVKVTQASRDGGVDAVAFDPDPIRGGKIVIQAKRYTNPVGVSAVRDLFGTVMNEGAIKGILVTTSNYGPDAYEFARGKPLTLLDGGNLLHLLERHGHRARIDIAEAKKIAAFRENQG